MKIETNYSNGSMLLQNNNRVTFKRNWAEHISWGAHYKKNSNLANFKMFTFPDAKAVFLEIADNAKSKLGNINSRMESFKLLPLFTGAFDWLYSQDKQTKIYKMKNQGEGIFSLDDVSANEGASYRYIVQNSNGNLIPVKDPYAKAQENIHGYSQIYDANGYKWNDGKWYDADNAKRITKNSNDKYHGLGDLRICEVNIPTLSDEGTYVAAKNAIERIADNKLYNAVEFMPVENTYSKQWGYDGVDKFAPNSNMGNPDKLKELIDFAHNKGLNVIMDMVPNHMGPDGNYLGITGPYISETGNFGDRLNYEGKNSKYVRDMMVNAALNWINDYHADGLRLDMVNECKSYLFLKQLVEEVNFHNPKAFIIVEEGRLDNIELITSYDNSQRNQAHEENINTIDSIINYGIKSDSNAQRMHVGSDSAWDFIFKHQLQNFLFLNGEYNIYEFDNSIRNSNHKVKYAMSHDEIGNIGANRLMAKIFNSELNLGNKCRAVNGKNAFLIADALAYELLKLCVTGEAEKLNEYEINAFAKEHGLDSWNYISKVELINVYNAAKAKKRTALATIFTLPGPKMVFQGDENFEPQRFKFFRYLQSYDNNPDEYLRLNAEKGYDTLEQNARQTCVINKVKINEDDKAKQNLFIEDLTKLVYSSKAFSFGDIVETYADAPKSVHMHQLKKDNDNFLIIKNYGKGFYDSSYGYNKFPDGTWVEVFNSDDRKYGGSGYTNNHRYLDKYNQNISVASNSVCVLKRVK